MHESTGNPDVRPTRRYGQVVALAACAALGALVTACGAPVVDDPLESATTALSGCDGNAFRACLASGGGGGCAKYCLLECRPVVSSCVRGGGGAGCMSRCRDGDVTGTPSGGGGTTSFDTSTCVDPQRARTFMGWVHQDANGFTRGERLCWCTNWHKIKYANGYSDDLTSRVAQLLCFGSGDGSVSLPNGDGDGAIPPGAALAIYCQLNPTSSGCR